MFSSFMSRLLQFAVYGTLASMFVFCVVFHFSSCRAMGLESLPRMVTNAFHYFQRKVRERRSCVDAFGLEKLRRASPRIGMKRKPGSHV